MLFLSEGVDHMSSTAAGVDGGGAANGLGPVAIVAVGVDAYSVAELDGWVRRSHWP